MAINKHTKSIMFIISMLIIIFSILCFNAVVIAEEIEDYNDYDEVLLKFLNTVIGENINIDEVEIQAETRSDLRFADQRNKWLCDCYKRQWRA